MEFSDLPEDIIHLIVSHLTPHDLLALCSTCQALHHNDDLVYSATFWSRATRRTFRLPQHPVAAGDGRRWMQLYRRMRTQTKAYLWGNDDLGSLGEDPNVDPALSRRDRRRFGALARPRRIFWPQQAQIGEITVVADLQAGGWSTTALSHKGELYTLGVIDGSSPGCGEDVEPQRLKYPGGYGDPAYNYDSRSAIAQFSAGRSHILGVSDSGKIWSWHNKHSPALHVRFLPFDMVEVGGGPESRTQGSVRKVIAGWDLSSAYVVGKGIVCWTPSTSAEIRKQYDDTGDGIRILEPWVIPGTNYLQNQKNVVQDELATAIGEVTNWILLEKHLLFTTHHGALYTVPMENRRTAFAMPQPIRLNKNVDLLDPEFHKDHVIDVQGSYHSFAVFKRSGEVLLGDENYIRAILSPSLNPERRPKLRKIPALQNSGVIAMAFGDWHYHALHSNGTITSYGHEPQSTGGLGLGDSSIDVARGIKARVQPFLRFDDGMLLNECLTNGRRVWFEPEKRAWLNWVVKQQPQLENPFQGIQHPTSARAEVSEWFEERLRRWEIDAPTIANEEEDVDEDADYERLPAYFALSVAAAGWHSGALVLVNEKKAERIRNRYRAQEEPAPTGIWETARSFLASAAGQTQAPAEWIWESKGEVFPRLKLASEEILPGSASVVELPAELRDWKRIEEVDLD